MRHEMAIDRCLHEGLSVGHDILPGPQFENGLQKRSGFAAVGRVVWSKTRNLHQAPIVYNSKTDQTRYDGSRTSKFHSVPHAQRSLPLEAQNPLPSFAATVPWSVPEMFNYMTV